MMIMWSLSVLNHKHQMFLNSFKFYHLPKQIQLNHKHEMFLNRKINFLELILCLLNHKHEMFLNTIFVRT